MASDRSAIVSTSSTAAAAGGGGMVVFDARLAKELVRRRFPTGYLGVRRLRPSSRAVARLMLSSRGATTDAGADDPTTTTPPVVFKVVDPDTGHERRMTAREKKAFKRELGAKRKRPEQPTTAVDGPRDLDPPANNEPSTALSAAARDDNDANVNNNSNNNNYLPWSIDAAKIEEEIADLRGAREGVPPVYLPPPLAVLALSTVVDTASTMNVTIDGGGGGGGGITTTSIDNDADAPSTSLSSRPPPRPLVRVVVDDEWAQRWANDLKKSMKPAEDFRDSEDMRPMPYHLAPEVWQRLRPATLGDRPTSAVTAVHDNNDNDETELRSSSATMAFPHGTSWSFCDLRPAPQRPHHDDDVVQDDIEDDDMDAATAAIVQVLHAGTGLHIACGAKFGCDYLLYDGPRGERHAFAGVRFLSAADADGSKHTSSCPPGHAYDLSGYVRCLNTAGKLALLAAARRDKTTTTTTTTANDGDDRGGDGGQEEQVVTYRVAIVDLALVKIVETTFKKPKKTMEQRLQNLAKTTTTQS
jgi:hypothetical protein